MRSYVGARLRPVAPPTRNFRVPRNDALASNLYFSGRADWAGACWCRLRVDCLTAWPGRLNFWYRYLCPLLSLCVTRLSCCLRRVPAGSKLPLVGLRLSSAFTRLVARSRAAAHGRRFGPALHTKGSRPARSICARRAQQTAAGGTGGPSRTGEFRVKTRAGTLKARDTEVSGNPRVGGGGGGMPTPLARVPA